jgi:hypothetical protein
VSICRGYILPDLLQTVELWQLRMLLAVLYEGVSKKFPDWPTGVRTANGRAILWVSLVSFAALTLCVVSQRVFVVYFVMTQSGNFWIHPRIRSDTAVHKVNLWVLYGTSFK